MIARLGGRARAGAARAIGLALVLSLAAHTAAAQGTFRDRGTSLLEAGKPADAEAVFAEWVRAEPKNADAHYLLGIALAQQKRMAEARKAFQQAIALEPGRADAHFEMAATFMATRDYSRAIHWAQEGLRLAPDDEYGLDLTGTIYFVSGARVEALRYWNRQARPHLTEITIQASKGVSRTNVASMINLAPGDLLAHREIEKARWWLNQARYIRNVRFDPVPGPTPDQYSLDVNVDARHGVGTLGELAFGALADIGFRTVRFNYWNFANSGITLSAKWRFRKSAERAGADIDIPRPFHLPVNLNVGYLHRDESWSASSQTNGFSFRTSDTSVSVTIPVSLPEVSLTASMTSRARVFNTLPSDTAEVAALDPSATGQAADRAADRALWFRFVPRFAWSTDRFLGEWDLRGAVRAGFEAGWTYGPATDRQVSRLWLSAEARLERGSRGGPQRRISAGFHMGRLSAGGLVEDRFVLAAGPDADFPLRGHLYVRLGHPGSAPLAREFVIGNVAAATDLATIKWFKVGVVAFADMGRVGQLYPGQAIPDRLFDAGIGLELGSAYFSSQRFTVMWGRDFRTGHSVIYVTSTIR